jgi:hypothetical protein
MLQVVALMLNAITLISPGPANRRALSSCDQRSVLRLQGEVATYENGKTRSNVKGAQLNQQMSDARYGCYQSGKAGGPYVGETVLDETIVVGKAKAEES